MSESEDYDVIIAGGGPSGSTAAYQLGEFGYDVLLVDKATFPRDKLCGGLVTNKTVRLVERVFNKTEQYLLDNDIVDFASDGFEVYFEDDLLHSSSIDIPFYFTNRSVYDNFLFEQAQSTGVDVVQGEGVEEVSPSEAWVSTESGRTFEADYVVAADGANSVIRRQLFQDGWLDATEWRENLAMALECYVPRSETEFDPDVPLVHFGVIDWGYGWVFPNEDRLLVGVGGLNRKNDNFGDLLDAYLAQLELDHVDIEVKGHPLPFGNFIETPAVENVLLVGDAAGTADAITGEGIFYGQRSGELAAWSIHRAAQDSIDTTPGAYYVDMIQEYVHPELKHSKFLRPLIWAGPRRQRHPLMKALMKVGSRPLTELIHGVRVYRWFRPRGRELHDVV